MLSSPRRSIRWLAAAALMVMVTACASGGARPATLPGAPAPSAAVERFLRLAGEKKYGEMGWVFGTADGAVNRRDSQGEVEKRMFTIATILEHQSYTLSGEEPVPGRPGAAVRMTVRLTQRGRTFNVPFTAVRGPQGRWYVEDITLQAVTGQG